MSTAVAQPVKIAPALPGRRYDHIFFSTMSALMLVTVIAGFGPTYYFDGVFRAPLPGPIIHIHAVIFSCWMLLLIVQNGLVSAHRVDLHKRLGIAGFILACLMIVAGLAAATDSLVRAPVLPGRDVQAFYVITTSEMLMFAVLITAAYRQRRDSAAHKRLILIATASLLVAAVARLPIAAVHRPRVFQAGLASDVFLLALVFYDLWALHKLHRATIWGGAFLLIVQQVRFPIGQTAAWHSFAGAIQSALR